MKYIVGTNWIGYPEYRNFAGLKFKDFQIKKIFDLNKFIVFGYHKLGKITPQYYRNTFNDLNWNKCQLLHFFNGVNLTSKNWITTFETSLPRWGIITRTQTERGLKLMSKKNCKQLIALSECSKQIQLNLLEGHPSFRDELISKIKVLHPPQSLFIKNLNEKDTSSNFITFTIIGNQIFSKGGRECVNVISYLSKKGYPIQLNIISSLTPDMYASYTTQKDVNLFLKKIDQNKNVIRFIGKIPNDQAIAILKNTNIVLLPSYADTYGYSILEAQACGCPVISTNIRAIPEINNDTTGWLINVPKDSMGNAILKSEADRALLTKTIEAQLESIIIDIFNNFQEVEIKAKNAINRIIEHHNPLEKTEIIENLYNKCIELN